MIHPEYTDTGIVEHNGTDLMVMRLDRPVTGISPAVLSEGVEAIRDTASLIGWGAFGPVFPPQTPYFDKGKSGGQNIIDSFGGPLVKGLSSCFYMDMDDPGKRAPTRLGSSLSLPLEFISTGGDSGGGVPPKQNPLAADKGRRGFEK